VTDGHLELRIAWERHLGPGPKSLAWLDSVTSRYRERHRHYHDTRHLRWVVRHVEELGHGADELDAVMAAAFFHDVIYDPASAGNEASSGALAASALRELGWAPDRVATVEAMVVATAHHDLAVASNDETVLFAADLAVLAAEPAGYSDYVRNVRREYHHVGDADWAAGRTAVLRGLLDREHIYAPRLDLDAWERRARGNLVSELDTLAA